MLATLFSLALLGAQDAPPVAPIVPAGTNRSFHEAVLAVEDAMTKGNFTEATRRMKALPQKNLVITWDDANVPGDLKKAYAEARDKAIKSWAEAGLENKITVGEKGHLVVSFDKTLPDGELGVPQGAAYIFSFDPAEPRMRTVLSLQRGKPASRTMPNEVTNEMINVISQYYGCEISKRPAGARYRTDMTTNGSMTATPGDVFLVSRLAKVADALQLGITKKVPFKPTKPKLFLEMNAVQMPAVVQGDAQNFSISVTNNGDGPMSLWVEPDCSCLAPNAPPIIQPGQTALIQVFVNTIDWVGKLRKWLYVYSNDLDFPYREIPVDVNIQPLYRLIKDGGPVIQMGDFGAQAEFYFWSNDPEKMKPLQSGVSGLKGKVEMEPWEGEMADPEMGEGKLPRKGYKFRVNIDKVQLFGRSMSALSIRTNHPIFPMIKGSVSVQRGIVALPERVYLGEIPKAANMSFFVLSKPEIDFKITKIETDSPYVKATATPLKGGWEYKVNVEIDAKVEFGFLNANIIIHTNDPDQPQVIVPLEATVR